MDHNCLAHIVPSQKRRLHHIRIPFLGHPKSKDCTGDIFTYPNLNPIGPLKLNQKAKSRKQIAERIIAGKQNGNTQESVQYYR